jgi:hypothetical protein
MKSPLSEKLTALTFGSALMFSVLACSDSSEKTGIASSVFPPKPDPRSYVCYRAVTPITPDGIPDEKSWSDVPWTDYFVDIEGSSKPTPLLKTHAKMLWDDNNLYIAAEIEEPHVWAKLMQRDTVVFFDNDFEVFIDPDGDTQVYNELEINALGTAWDLLLIKPYRDGGPPVTGWDIAGLQVGTHVNGTINNPADEDKSWTAEIIIPLKALKETSGTAGLPKAGDRWRIDFSRVEWRTLIADGAYVKEINPSTGKPYPENNWVWSPQGRIDMHMPEMWGYLQFSAINAGAGSETFIPDPDFEVKWGLRVICYAENAYYLKNNTYTSSLEELGLKLSDFSDKLPAPVIQSTRSAFESYFPAPEKTPVWTIYQDGRIKMVHSSAINK